MWFIISKSSLNSQKIEKKTECAPERVHQLKGVFPMF